MYNFNKELRYLRIQVGSPISMSHPVQAHDASWLLSGLL